MSSDMIGRNSYCYTISFVVLSTTAIPMLVVSPLAKKVIIAINQYKNL